MRKFNSHYVSEVQTPIGHILSVIVEELKVEKPNLKKIVDEINNYIFQSGNGHAKIRSINDKICEGDKVHWGIGHYLTGLNLEYEEETRIQERVQEELRGIIPEDRIFEKDGTFARYHSN